MDFNTVWLKGSKNPFRGDILALDPGHTTGYSIWSASNEGVCIEASGQIKTWHDEDLVSHTLKPLIHSVAVIVMESYQVYDWKKDEHSWSQIPTVQVIGCIKTICQIQGKPYYSQTAQVAKQFVTDEKLEKWGFWKKGERHARDSMRHGIYWLLFGKP